MPRVGEVVSHWHHSVENFNTSTLEFYASVEQALSEKGAQSVFTSRLDWNESGLFSAKREYLRITFGRFSFDICAAPFGKDFFFSWWLTKRQAEASLLIGCGTVLGLIVLFAVLLKVFGAFLGFVAFAVTLAALIALASRSDVSGANVLEDLMASLPIWGQLYRRFIRPVTYFSEDSRLIFEESVHRIVLRHVESLLSVAKLQPLTAEQAKAQSQRPV